MKPANDLVYNTITNDHHNEVATVVRAEWSLNNFYNTLVDNTPSEDDEAYDPEYFPIDSITDSNRPLSGICKAIVGRATVEPRHHETVPSARYYMVDPDDEYKYWQSPMPTNSSGVFPVFNAANFPAPVGSTYSYDSQTCVRPQVRYVSEENEAGDTTPIVVKANKISFTIENTYSHPSDYDVQIMAASGGNWTTIATNPDVPVDGKVQLWYNGTGWTTTPSFGGTANVHAVRLVVRKMYVPVANRTVETIMMVAGVSTIISEVKGTGGSFSQADVGATVSGSGIPTGTKIRAVREYKTVDRVYKLKNGTIKVLPDGWPRPANVQTEGDPIVRYLASAELTKAATATGAGRPVNVSVTPVGAYFSLIELGACLERDLSSDLVSWSDGFSMGEKDFITPLGNISTNTGQVTLFNGDDNLYRNNNKTSPYYMLLDKGVVFRCWMKYGDNLIQEFEMYSESWDESDESTSVSLVDQSTRFMEVKPRPVMYQDIPVQEAIWRICDIIGFTNYEITTIDETATIDIFWTDGEKTAWEIFSELARATQTAIYFDSRGRLNIKTRDAAWDSNKGSAYDFARDSVPGGAPANIVSLSESTSYEANKVTVNYQPTGFSETRDNIVPFEVVWEPEGTVVLRASNLAKNLLLNDMVVYLQTKEGKTWPWSGLMNIEGEWISFDAKQYVHYENGVRKTTWVTDHDQQKKLDERAGAFHRHLNSYTGALRLDGRGMFGTEKKAHRIDLDGWSKSRRRNFKNTFSKSAGIKHNTAASTVTLEGADKFNMEDFTYLHRGNTVDQGSRYMGFRMKVDKTTHKDKVGGFFFAGDEGLGSGYFLEVMATARMDGAMRNTRNEVMLYSMNPNGTSKSFGGEVITMPDKSKNSKKNAKVKINGGSELAVPMDRFIDFDIWFTKSDSVDTIEVFANGRPLMTAKVEGTWRHRNVSAMGLYSRGHSKVTFDYVYAINSPGVDMIDSESYFDRIAGGYYSTQASDWTFNTKQVRRRVWVNLNKKRKKKGGRVQVPVWRKYTQRYGQRFYEEFGPVAHEAREFDVKFTNSLPVLESKLYMSNSSQVVCPEYTGYIKGAKFMLTNISRQAAIINGDDEATAMGNGTINHKLFVYGRPVIQGEAQEVIREDEWAIRRRGPIEVEYSSPWIQNEAEAERFGDWLTTHWSRSDSTLEVEVFGNPLIELTDVVRVKYNHIDAYFYVVGVANTYEQGLSTSLTLRKAMDA